MEHVSGEDRKILICGLTLQETGTLVTWLSALLHTVSEKDWERLKDYKASEIQQYINIMQKAKAEFGPHGLLDATEMFGTLLLHVRDVIETFRGTEKIKEDLAYIFVGFLQESLLHLIEFT